jgi:hypothetical protein
LVDIEEDGLSKEILMTIEPTRMWGLIFFRWLMNLSTNKLSYLPTYRE